jgi:UDP-N-acetyl-2-amino-2-deoxyglucuronate dehydrogenase
MQLRYHPALMELKSKLNSATSSADSQSSMHSNQHAAMQSNNSLTVGKHKVQLKYVTPRGKWYHTSWKGDVEKSGGICTNIGIHLFDLLLWLYGESQSFEIKQSDENKAAGKLILRDADVNWFLSIDKNDLPDEAVQNKKISYRSLIADGEQIEFSDGFTDLHTEVYREILDGRGLGIKDARPSIELVEKLRM